MAREGRSTQDSPSVSKVVWHGEAGLTLLLRQRVTYALLVYNQMLGEAMS